MYCVWNCTVLNDTRHCHKTDSDVTIGQCIVSETVQFSTTQDTVRKQTLASPSDSVLCLAQYSFQPHHRTVYCVWHCTVLNDTRHCHKTGSDDTIGQCIVSGTVQFSTTQDTVMKQTLTTPSNSVLCLALYSFQRHKTLS